MKINTGAITNLTNDVPKNMGKSSEDFYSNVAAVKKAEQVTLDKTAGRKIDEDVLNTAVDKANKTARIFNRQIHFKVHEASKRWMVQIIDTDTGDVVREIPPEKVLDMIAQLDQLVGLLVDERR